MRKYSIIILLFLLSFASFGQQTNPQKTRILFVFDASLSMLGKWENNKKIDVAIGMLSHLIDSLRDVPNVQLALRIYGHQSYVPPQDCSDTKLEIPFRDNNADAILKVLKFLQPKGTTLIAKSLEYAANDFPTCSNCRNIIILITDGEEECNGDPCAVSLALQKQGIILKPFVIGIGLDDKLKAGFECVGNYFDAAKESDFSNILGMVISQALNNTTCQINLLDENGNPTETNVNMTLYDRFSGEIKYNFIHTLNHRVNPDTMAIEPLFTYDIVVHTIPPVRIDSAKLSAGKHNIFAVDAPQGYLYVKTNKNYKKSIKTIVRKTGSMETLNAQEINTAEKYITGNYDVEILTLPIMKFNNINIKQSYTTTLQVPEPGLITFFRQFELFGSIYILRDGKMEWVSNLSPHIRKETLSLQPGKYIIIYRSRYGNNILLSKRKTFEAESGRSQVINL
jgi:Ca-activated chloride channel family protein